MTKQEAIEKYNSKFWLTMTNKEIAKFQINEERLCVPFDIFHKAVEKTLDRAVLTHELAIYYHELKEEINKL